MARPGPGRRHRPGIPGRHRAAGAAFLHPTRRGHTVFAYVIAGRGYFCKEKQPFSHEVEGRNYFDMEWEPFVGNETLVLFGDGDQVMVTTEAEPVRFLLISGEAHRRTGGLVRPHRHEHGGGTGVAFEEYRKGTFIKSRGN